MFNGCKKDDDKIEVTASFTVDKEFLGGPSVAANKMKETGILHWTSPNTGATNESGFTALPTGSRYSVVGTFNEMGIISKTQKITIL